ncbi:MAG: hypothetical protein OXG18_02605 [Gemmatimonadetes bacterium]|nr:hypothetical protein [Gemmatimonadota bacterium]
MPGMRFPRWGTDRGVSPESHIFLRRAARIRRDDRGARSHDQARVRERRWEALSDAFRDCGQKNWDGYGAAPADPSAAAWAAHVLDAFPSGLGVPEVAFEPDGAAGFEWWRGPDNTLAVSVARDGQVRFAARLGREQVSGTGAFADGLPSDLIVAAYRLIA